MLASSSSHVRKGARRGPYKRYLTDPDAPIPRSTKRRWQKMEKARQDMAAATDDPEGGNGIDNASDSSNPSELSGLDSKPQKEIHEKFQENVQDFRGDCSFANRTQPTECPTPRSEWRVEIQVFRDEIDVSYDPRIQEIIQGQTEIILQEIEDLMKTDGDGEGGLTEY